MVNYNEIEDQVGLHTASQQGSLIANQTRQLQYQMEEGEKNLAEAQLDCNETLTEIRHNLKQDVMKVNESGVLDWEEIEDEKKRTLTNEGVDFIMSVMRQYINKETLLSNFDDKTIDVRMLQISTAFNNNIFMKFEIYFRTPTLDECYDLLRERKDNKIKQIILTNKLLEREYNEDEIRKKVTEDMEPQIEKEILKIKEEQKQINLRSYEIIFTYCTHLIHATHNRAWKGEERGSLRRHFNISEVIGGKSPIPQTKGGWFGWGNK